MMNPLSVTGHSATTITLFVSEDGEGSAYLLNNTPVWQ